MKTDHEVNFMLKRVRLGLEYVAEPNSLYQKILLDRQDVLMWVLEYRKDDPKFEYKVDKENEE